MVQEKVGRAAQLLRSLLEVAPTPSLWCTLGDVLDDDALLEKAWALSNQRLARAKRLLGASAFKRADYEAAKRHLSDALAVNAQFPSAWFRLGAAAMRTRDWPTAKTAYSRAVMLEPDDGDSWANLATVLDQLGESEAAFKAAGEAVRHANLNWRVWDSYLTLALRGEHVDAAITALDVLIDVSERRADSGGARVDATALLTVVGWLLRGGDDDAAAAATGAAGRVRARFAELVAKIKAKSESRADVWAVLAHYYESLGDRPAHRDALLRRCRALMRGERWWETAPTVKQLCLTARALVGVAVAPRSDSGAPAPQALGGEESALETAYFVDGVLQRVDRALGESGALRSDADVADAVGALRAARRALPA